jgi:hypothetical protein
MYYGYASNLSKTYTPMIETVKKSYAIQILIKLSRYQDVMEQSFDSGGRRYFSVNLVFLLTQDMEAGYS